MASKTPALTASNISKVPTMAPAGRHSIVQLALRHLAHLLAEFLELGVPDRTGVPAGLHLPLDRRGCRQLHHARESHDARRSAATTAAFFKKLRRDPFSTVVCFFSLVIKPPYSFGSATTRLIVTRRSTKRQNTSDPLCGNGRSRATQNRPHMMPASNSKAL